MKDKAYAIYETRQEHKQKQNTEELYLVFGICNVSLVVVGVAQDDKPRLKRHAAKINIIRQLNNRKSKAE